MATSNSMNMDEAGIQTFNTTTGNLTGSTTTQYNVLIGDTSNKLTNVAPSATSGVPLISSGSSANPAFGTAVVAGGGTGNTTFTAYSVIAAGTTSTGVFQNVSGVGTSGQVLISNGASALPSWQTSSGGAGGLVITVAPDEGNPTNGSTYYLANCGQLTDFTLSRGSTRFYIPSNGTITKAYGRFACNTVGTNENVTVAIRLNDTTNTNISSTIQLDTSPVVFSNTALSIAVSAGDFIDFVMINPTWVNDPDGVDATITIYIT